MYVRILLPPGAKPFLAAHQSKPLSQETVDQSRRVFAANPIRLKDDESGATSFPSRPRHARAVSPGDQLRDRVRRSQAQYQIQNARRTALHEERANCLPRKSRARRRVSAFV